MLAGENANIIFGAMYDETMQDQAVITVIATGLQEKEYTSIPGGNRFAGGYTPNAGAQQQAAKPGVAVPSFLNRSGFAPSASTGAQTQDRAMEQFDYKFDPNAVRPKTTTEYKPTTGASPYTSRGNSMFGKPAENTASDNKDEIKIPPFIQNYSAKKK